MSLTSTTSSSYSSTSSRKRQLEDSGGAESSKKFKCEPCKKYFKEHKSLLRHERENSKHRWRPLNVTSTFTCQLCPKTFARVHDRERHFKEQHLDGKSPCPGCGKHIRPNAPHKNSDGLDCLTRHSSGIEVEDNATSVSSTSAERTELSTCQGPSIPDCTSVLDNLSEQLSRTSLQVSPTCPNIYKRNVRAVKRSRILPCGICGLQFELHDPTALFQHLKDHMEGFKGAYRCGTCEIEFMSSNDLEKHESSAKQGDCGFFFHHKTPCTGHHPPTKRPLHHLAEGSDDDRFAFCYRIRTWEQSQLAAYLSSVERLIEVDPVQGECMTTVTGVNRCGLTYGFRRRQLADCGYCRILEFHEKELKGVPGDSFKRHGKEDCPSLHLAHEASKELVSRLSQPVDGPLGWKLKRRNSFSGRCHSQAHDAKTKETHSQQFVETRTGAVAADPAYFTMTWLQLLHRACCSGDLELVQSAIDNDADVDGQDFEGSSPLHLAIFAGAPDVVEFLLQSGARLDVKNKRKKTPLHVAMRYGSSGVIELLIKYGAIDADNARGGGIVHIPFYESPLHKAFVHDGIEQRETYEEILLRTLSIVLERGAAVDTQNHFGRTPLQLAVWQDIAPAVALLLKHGANPHQQSYIQGYNFQTLLSHAIRHQPQIAKLLIEYGAIVDEADFLFAINHDMHEDFINRLFDQRSIANSPPLGFKALKAAISYSRTDIQRQLLDRGAEHSPIGQKWDDYPIVEAARVGSVEMIENLLTHGATLDIRLGGYTVGEFALHCAVSEGWTEVLQFFLDLGFVVNNDIVLPHYFGETLLSLAFCKNELACAELLVRHGADLEAKDARGNTVLIAAAIRGNSDIVRYLLSVGADANGVGAAGHTALCRAYTDLVRGHERDAIISQLRKAGAGENRCKRCYAFAAHRLKQHAAVDREVSRRMGLMARRMTLKFYG